ncbi:ornithine cyclodeaminase family protein [Salsuginibacillus kocurii]|uniref:ornithine cyclodeaminase family protein n=1 Tax=Salsuginibacillus kocurii TaxID=427078 RepID=UPI000360D77D|nr:NAD(P)-binding domain-containing protein [Salsuginibacillus kocurii]
MIHLSYEEVYSTITMKEVIEEIEAFYLDPTKHHAVVPDRLFVEDGENTAILKPSFFDEFYTAKLVGIAPGNANRGEPTLKGMVFLSDRSTMEPLGLFDAKSITALRTGALAGLSIRHLTDPHLSSVGIIGTGEQGWSHLEAALAVRPITDVYINNRSAERLKTFKEQVQSHFEHLNVHEVDAHELVRSADIIIATTTSTTPVLPEYKEVDYAGKHIAASGSFRPHMQEIPASVLKHANRMFVDTYAAFHESKDMIVAREHGKDEDSVFTLDDLINQASFNTDAQNRELTIFKSVGKSIYDLITARLLYKKLKQIV